MQVLNHVLLHNSYIVPPNSLHLKFCNFIYNVRITMFSSITQMITVTIKCLDMKMFYNMQKLQIYYKCVFLLKVSDQWKKSFPYFYFNIMLTAKEHTWKLNSWNLTINWEWSEFSPRIRYLWLFCAFVKFRDYFCICERVTSIYSSLLFCLTYGRNIWSSSRQFCHH